MKDLNQCLALKADDARTIYERGRVRRAKGDPDGAIADFNAVIELMGEKGQNALFYNNLGLAKLDKADANAAIADFSKGLELKPPQDLMLLLLVNRARAEMFKNDADAALADATRASQINPNFPDAFVFSAMAKQAKGDNAGAVADVTRAINLDARNSRLYLNRANIELEQGDFKKAGDDYEKAVELSPTDPEFRAQRGYFRYDQHLWADALADFKFAFDNAPPPHDDYVQFRICLIGMNTGNKVAAAKAMHDYLGTRKAPKKSDDWASRVGAFLAGDLTELQFMKAADNTIKKTSDEQHCEAYYYAGAKALANGEKDVAKADFEKCVATGINYFTEYRSAKAELRMMGVKP